MRKYILPIIIVIFLGLGCKETEIEIGESPRIDKAVAVLKPIQESEVSGIIYFNDKGGMVEIIADIYGLNRGEHGVHIHNYGDLSAPDAKSTGTVFDPPQTDGTGDNINKTLPGNLGNIFAMNDTLAQMKKEIYSLSLNGENSIIGRAIVVHEREDDYSTQPCGNAGGILAAGIIGIASE